MPNFEQTPRRNDVKLQRMRQRVSQSNHQRNTSETSQIKSVTLENGKRKIDVWDMPTLRLNDKNEIFALAE
jgi:hypothetical protein